MTSEHESGSSKLDEIIAEFLQRVEAGEAVDREALLRQHPEFADELREFLADDSQWKRVARADDSETSPTIDVTPRDVSDVEIAPTFDSEAPAGAPKVAPQRVGYFGDYELLEEIARGGMGVVYKARQANLDRVVALKMILSGQLASEDDVRRFYQEAEAAANLEHPGIVPVFEVGEHDGQHFFSMGYIDGPSLAQLLSDGPLPTKEAAQVVRQVAEAIAYAHARGVIHRDLKPANILLARRDERQAGSSKSAIAIGSTPEHPDRAGLYESKVTDFGLAKRTEGTSELTGTGQILGTPSYMPPEQASGKAKEIGPAADVYSLGAILYSALTGHPPFQAANPMDTLMQVLKNEPPAPRQLNPQTPRDLETICLKCLQKEPAKRYESAQALADELGRWLEDKPILARPVGPVERTWRWCRRNPYLSAALAAVAVSLVVGTVVSSIFAVQANSAKRAAEERARAEADAKVQAHLQREAALAAKNQAEAARDELAKSNDRLLTSMARSLLRPLAVQVETTQPLPPLSKPEADALMELGAADDERLRHRFLEAALRNEIATKQLRYRAEFAMHAVTGLDPQRRAAFERLLAERLSDPEASFEQRVDLAVCLAALGNASPETSNRAYTILMEAAAQYTDRYAYSAQTLGDALAALAVRLEPADASDAAALVTQKVSHSDHVHSIGALLQGLTALAPALRSAEAHQAAVALTDKIAQQERFPGPMIDLSACLTVLVSRLEKEEAASLSDTLVKEILSTTRWQVQRELAKSLAVTAAHWEPAELNQATNRLIDQIRNSEVYFEGLSPNLAALTMHLRGDDAQQAARLLAQSLQETDNPMRMIVLSRGLAAVSVQLKAEEARKAARVLFETMDRSTLQQVFWQLSQDVAAVAEHLEPEHAKQAAKQMLEAFTKTTNAYALGELTRSFNAVVEHLEENEPLEVVLLLIKVIVRTPAEDNRSMTAAVQATIALASQLKDEAATKTAENVILTVRKVPFPGQRQALSEVLVSVAARLSPEKCAELITTQIKSDHATYELESLPVWLPVMAARLKAEDARTIANVLGQAVIDAEQPLAIGVYAKGLATVAAQLNAGQAADACAASFAKVIRMMTTDAPASDGELAGGLAALAQHLKTDQAREASAILVQTVSRTDDPAELISLAVGVAAAAHHLDERQAHEAAQVMLDTLKRAPDSDSASALSMSIAALSARMSEPSAGAIRTDTAGVAMRVASELLPPADAEAGASFAAALKALIGSGAVSPLVEVPPLSAPTLAELLEHPLCVAEARRAILDALGDQYEQEFIDQWDFVRFAESFWGNEDCAERL